MTGDGTNDAPALAQADVAVAMNTGTQAAKEAGNMIDLDSNPTKLLEVVETGKQMLMTRGSLTTFSIANDVAKYFAIIPAAFATTYPVLDALNVMRLATPQSAILSAVIFNALIIVALIPLALKGVRYRAARRGRRAATQPVGLRRRRHPHPVPGHQAHRHDPGRPGLGVSREEATPCMLTFVPRIVSLAALTVVTGVVYPLVVTGIAQVVFPYQANGSLIVRDGKAVGSALIGQPFDDPKYFWGRPSATSPFGYNAAASSGSNQGPTNPALVKAVQERVDALRAADPGNRAPVPGGSRHRLGQRARSSHQPRRRPVPGRAGGAGPEARAAGRQAARGAAHGGPLPRHPRRSRGSTS